MGMGGRVSFYFLFVYMWSRHVFIVRALCGTEHRADAFVLQESLLKYLEQWPAALTPVDIKGSTIPRIEPITVIVSALFLVCA
jgi:hypothetical protein